MTNEQLKELKAAWPGDWQDVGSGGVGLDLLGGVLVSASFNAPFWKLRLDVGSYSVSDCGETPRDVVRGLGTLLGLRERFALDGAKTSREAYEQALKDAAEYQRRATAIATCRKALPGGDA